MQKCKHFVHILPVQLNYTAQCVLRACLCIENVVIEQNLLYDEDHQVNVNQTLFYIITSNIPLEYYCCSLDGTFFDEINYVCMWSNKWNSQVYCKGIDSYQTVKNLLSNVHTALIHCFKKSMACLHQFDLFLYFDFSGLSFVIAYFDTKLMCFLSSSTTPMGMHPI